MRLDKQKKNCPEGILAQERKPGTSTEYDVSNQNQELDESELQHEKTNGKEQRNG